MTPPISRSRTGSLSAPIERDIPPMSNQSMHGAPASSPPSDEELPSLVTQLQQMHGLTKKKVYSTKPKRRPFVSSEVYREHPRKSSSLSPVSPSDTNHGGRVTSPSVLDRTGRVYYQGGSSVQPSTSTVARSIVDLSGSSHSASAPGSEVGPSAPGSLYPSPTAIPVSPVPSPPSPILNHAPPSWDPSVAIASPPTAVTYQQQPSPPTINTTHAQVGLHSQRGYLTTAPGLSARANTVPNVPPNINPATIPSRHNSVDTHAPSSIGGTHHFQFLGYQGSNEDHLNLSGMNVNTTVGSRANMNYSMPSMQNRHSISAPLYRDSPLERGPPVPVGSQAAMSPSQSIQHQRLQRPERRLTHASSLSEGSNSYSAPALNPYPNSSPWFNNSGSSTAFNSSTSSTISPYAASSASASSSSSSLPASPLVPTSTPTFMSSMPPSALSPYGMSMRLTHPPPPTPLSTPALHATPRYEYDSSASTAASSYPSSPTSSSTSSLTGWAG
ncbi:hypothetical protein D9757_003171 [Collybiopsis confluens]|uniref:Uncharacterized protein n=1 Tax=Collybiopsis confluens TaxID=2823264 RepID=A0A8H5HXD8_9AGAR|nr:hypothetical protein D9757_003171 [Collybiopsis confluens]